MDMWEFEMCKIKADRQSETHHEDYRKTLELAEKFRERLGDHEQTSTAFKRVGDFCLEKRMNYSEAMQHYQVALEIMTELQGGDAKAEDVDGKPEVLEWPQSIMLWNNLATAKYYHAFETESLDEADFLVTIDRAETLAQEYFPHNNHFWVLKLFKNKAEIQHYCAVDGARFCSFE